MPSATGNMSGSGPQQVYVWLSYHSMDQPGNRTRWYWEIVFKNNGGQSWYSNADHWWQLSGFAVTGKNYFGIPSSWVGTDDHLLGSGTFYKAHNSDGYLSAGTLTGTINTAHNSIGDGSAGVSSGTPPRVPKPPDAPPAPVKQSATTYDTLVFKIAQPADNGGSGITNYDIRIYLKNANGTYSLQQQWKDGSSIQSRGGLKANTEYWVQYNAINAYGTGPASTITAMSTDAGPPSAPLNLQAVVTDLGEVTFTWDAPTDNGGKAINEYVFEWANNSAFSPILGGAGIAASPREQVISALVPGSTVWFRVLASNGDTDGPWTSISLVVASGAKVWTGSSWKTAVVKVWNGSTWRVAKVWVCTDTDPLTWTLAK